MSKKDILISLVVTIVIFWVINIITEIIIYPMNHYTHEYTDFSKSRIKEIEKTFGLTIDDNVDLKVYIVKKDINLWFYTLEIDNISDDEKFITDNVRGSLKTKYKNNVFHDYEENEKIDVNDDSDDIEYTYKFEYEKGPYRDVYIEFIQQNDTYSAVLKTEYEQYVDDTGGD